METEKKERPQDRWDKKNGYISKSFRMYRDTADAFAAACTRAGESQSSVITRLMKQYIAEHPEEEQ